MIGYREWPLGIEIEIFTHFLHHSFVFLHFRHIERPNVNTHTHTHTHTHKTY